MGSRRFDLLLAFRMDSSTPLVSVLLPCYNYAQYVGKALRSVLEQSHSHLQVIVIDNGSTDNSAQIIREFTDPRLEVYTLPRNEGLIPAWELGLQKAKGDWFAWLSADDFLHPEKFTRQLEFSRANPEANAIVSFVEPVDEKDGPVEETSPRAESASKFAALINQSHDLSALELWEWAHHVCMSTVLYRMDLCRAAGAPSRGMSTLADWEFHLRLLRKGVRFGLLPERLTYYRFHEANLTLNPGQGEQALEWCYGYATQYFPYLRESGQQHRAVVALDKFAGIFRFDQLSQETNTLLWLATCFPDFTARTFASFAEFSTRTEETLPVCYETITAAGLAMGARNLKHRLFESSDYGRHMEGVEAELQRKIGQLKERAERLEGERDRLKAQVHRLRAEDQDRQSRRGWMAGLRRLFGLKA